MLKKIENIPFYAFSPGAMINFISSNYPCLEHILMVPKVFEPLKFYYITNAFL